MSALSIALNDRKSSIVDERGSDESPARSVVTVPKTSTTDTMDLGLSPPTRSAAGLLNRQRTGSTSSSSNAPTTGSRRVSPSGPAQTQRYSLSGDLVATPPSSLDNHLLSSPKQLPLHVPLRTGYSSSSTVGSPYPAAHSSHRGSPAASGPGPISTDRRRYSNSSAQGGFAKGSPSALSLLSTAPSVPSSLHDSYGSSRPAAAASGGPLNANSPLALAAAAQVTPDKLSRLLLTQGPLAIRHITSHLALNITGFADLSSSKQRRLIIAVLDSGDPVNNVVFEKISWGRWAARKVDHKLLSKEARRQSITSGLYSARPPISPVLKPQDGLKAAPGSSFSRRESYNTNIRSGLSSWAVDDVDLADDDMMFHNSTDKHRGSARRRDHSGRVFEDDIDDVAIVSDDDDEDDEEEDDSDDFALSSVPGSFSRRSQVPAAPAHKDSLVGARKHGGGDTDEEDWQSVGAEGLRGNPIPIGKREQEAIDALVQLRSI